MIAPDVVLPVPPQWPCDELVGILTEVLPPSFNETEQRRILRSRPTMILEGEWAPADPVHAQLVNNVLIGFSDKVIGVPWWPAAIGPTQVITQGSSVVYVDTQLPVWFAPGYVIAYVSPSSYEVQAISSVVTGQVILTGTWVSAWPVTSLVMPVMPCYVDGPPDADWRNQKLCRLRARFTAALEDV